MSSNKVSIHQGQWVLVLQKSWISFQLVSESSDLCINTRACLDPQIKITAKLLLLSNLSKCGIRVNEA